jgi:hypothetical protein
MRLCMRPHSLSVYADSGTRFKRVGPNAMKGRGIGTARGRATIMRGEFYKHPVSRVRTDSIFPANGSLTLRLTTPGKPQPYDMIPSSSSWTWSNATTKGYSSVGSRSSRLRPLVVRQKSAQTPSCIITHFFAHPLLYSCSGEPFFSLYLRIL